MAITVMGGLTICTFLTLFVIPALYVVSASWLERKKPKAAPSAASIVSEQIKPEPKPVTDIAVMPSKALVLEKSQPVPSPQDLPKKQEEPRAPYLTKRQSRLLEHIKKAGRITRKEYSDLFNISVPTAARDLRYLMDKGFLKAEGPLGPGRWYELK
jgi:predicted HTH transcriptional regulator